MGVVGSAPKVDALERLVRVYARRVSTGETGYSAAIDALVHLAEAEAEKAGEFVINPVHHTRQQVSGREPRDADFWTRVLDDRMQALEIGGAAALWPEVYTPPLRPIHPLPTFSANDARAAVEAHIRGVLSRTLAWGAEPEEARPLPEHTALAVEVGAGKTTKTCESLPGFIAAAKARRQRHRVLVFVPTHKLSGEVNDRLTALGIHSETWRGREAINPETGDPMCSQLPAVRDALFAGEDVEEAVCGKAGGPRCPAFDTCPYQLAKAKVAKADVVVAAHETMLGRLPSAFGRGFALAITDESWLQSGAETRTLGFDTLYAGEIAHPVPRMDQPDLRDDVATNDLHVLRRRLASAMEMDGYLRRDALIAAGLTAALCKEAYRLEWRRKVTGVIRPNMTTEARREAMRRCAGNAAIPRLAALWKAAIALLDSEDEATGRVQLSRRENAEGSQRVILLHTVRPVAERVQALPILVLDATLPDTLLRHRLPRLTVLARIRAVTPHMRVHQVTGGFGKTSIIPHHPKVSKTENQRRLNLIAELRDFILLTTGGERALVVTYQDLEPFFADLPGVETAHFGAVEGLDQWGPQPGQPGIRHLFQTGRPLASPEATRRLSAALTGRPVAAELPGLVTRGATMRDGSAAPLEVRAYADPDMEAVRASITDAASEQVSGRGRGINRTENNPLDVWLLAGDVVAPLPLDTLTLWQAVAPGPSARMAARGVVLSSPSDAARAYPDLFPTAGAAWEALAREAKASGQQQGDFGHIPLWEILIGECVRNTGAWVRVRYRPAGRGQQTRTAWARTDRLPHLRAWLEAAADAELTLYELLAEQLQHKEVPPMPAPTPAPTPSLALRLARASLALDSLRPKAAGSASIHTPPWRSRWLDPELVEQPGRPGDPSPQYQADQTPSRGTLRRSHLLQRPSAEPNEQVIRGVNALKWDPGQPLPTVDFR